MTTAQSTSQRKRHLFVIIPREARIRSSNTPELLVIPIRSKLRLEQQERVRNLLFPKPLVAIPREPRNLHPFPTLVIPSESINL